MAKDFNLFVNKAILVTLLLTQLRQNFPIIHISNRPLKATSGGFRGRDFRT